MSSDVIYDAALYLAMYENADEVFTVCGLDDFPEGNYRQLASVIDAGRSTVLQADLRDWVYNTVQRTGSPSMPFFMHVATCGIVGSPGYWAQKVHDEGLRSRYIEVMTRGLQMAQSMESVQDAIARTRQEIADIRIDDVIVDDTWDLDYLMGLSLADRRFTIPNLLARSERLVLTGREGGGKSVLVYQLLTSAAFGIDPLTQEHCEPQRAMMVDVENSVYQMRDNLDRVVPVLRELRPDVQPEWRSLKRRVIDLLATREKHELIRAVVHYAPDILYMGTAYRLTSEGEEVSQAHRTARAIQSTVDAIRAEIDCSVVIEHHSGHGTMNDRNGGRPEGSSFWMRWPDFGKAMFPKQLPNDSRRFMQLSSWRGNRSARNWPVAFIQGQVMPWNPVSYEQYQAVYQPILGDLPGLG